MTTEEAQVEGWDIAPEEEIEVAETATSKELREDLDTLMSALRKIANIHPMTLYGGPSNKHFGKKIIVAFEKARTTALQAVAKQVEREMAREQRIYNDVEEESD